MRARGCGCIGHPAFPAPSVSRAERSLAKLGRDARREHGCASLRQCDKARGRYGKKSAFADDDSGAWGARTCRYRLTLKNSFSKLADSVSPTAEYTSGT